jgi:hypothetical protein
MWNDADDDLPKLAKVLGYLQECEYESGPSSIQELADLAIAYGGQNTSFDWIQSERKRFRKSTRLNEERTIQQYSSQPMLQSLANALSLNEGTSTSTSPSTSGQPSERLNIAPIIRMIFGEGERLHELYVRGNTNIYIYDIYICQWSETNTERKRIYRGIQYM